MQRTRRLLVTAASILLALLLGACAGPTDQAGPQPAGASAQLRTVEHAMGATEISGTPQRVVVLDTGELDSMLALGVKPVGMVSTDAAGGLQGYLAERTRGIARVGTIDQPNLEAIAALDPDLILSNKARHEQIYDKLSAIAPTVFAESVGEAWKNNFLLDAEAVGKQQQAQRLLAGYQRKARQIARGYGDPAQIEVSMVRFMSGSIRLYCRGSFIGSVLADMGFSRPGIIQRCDDTFVEISREQLARADGDLVFYSGYGTAGKALMQRVTAGPLWQRLGAASRGNAYQVPDAYWYLGIGPTAAGKVLDDLASYAPKG